MRRSPVLSGLAVLAGAAVVLAVAWAIVLGGGMPSTNGPLATATPTPAASLHLTAAGDYSSSDAAASVLDQISALGPDLHLALGDLSYGKTGEEGEWCDFVKSKVGDRFPFELVSGNHEADGEKGDIEAFASCLPNRLPGLVGLYARQYYVDVPQGRPLARIILISPGFPFPDGVWSYAKGSARYDWTAAAIDGARSAGIPWTIVGMHTVCVSIGEKTCEAGTDITNLLVSKRVDLVLNGHEHFYQRTKQLGLTAGCPRLIPEKYNADCVTGVGTTQTKGAGTVFVTAGTGGQKLRQANVSDGDVPYFAAYADTDTHPSHGLAEVLLTPKELTYSFVPTDSTYRDSLTISSR
jgi:hypothetical protein